MIESVFFSSYKGKDHLHIFHKVLHMAKNKEVILEFIRLKKEVSYGDLLAEFSNINESTLARNLTKLTKADLLEKRKQ